MISCLICATVLIVVLLALRPLLKRTPARLRYALWGLVLLRLALPFPLLSSGWSVMNVVGEPVVNELPRSSLHDDGPLLREPWEDAAADTPVEAEILPSQPTAVTAPAERELWGDIPAAETAAPDAEAPNQASLLREGDRAEGVVEGVQLLRILWLSGSIVVGAWFIIGNVRFALQLRKTREYYGKYAKLPVYLVENIPSPCLAGLLRPAIYLTPEAAARPDMRAHVLAHERAHYRHGDHVWSLARGLCLTAYWFHPLVWVAAWLSRRDCELACDETALRGMEQPERIAYGRTLLALVSAQKASPLRLATTMTAGKRELTARIHAIAERRKTVIAALVAVLLIAAVAVGCTFTGAKTEEPTETPTNSEETEVSTIESVAASTINPEFVRIAYASESRLAFYGGFGFCVYDLTESKLLSCIDLEQALGSAAMQGSSVLEAQAWADGSFASVHLTDGVHSDRAVAIDLQTGEASYSEWVPYGEPFAGVHGVQYIESDEHWEEVTLADGKTGYLSIPGLKRGEGEGPIEDLCYTYGGNRWVLFPDGLPEATPVPTSHPTLTLDYGGATYFADDRICSWEENGVAVEAAAVTHPTFWAGDGLTVLPWSGTNEITLRFEAEPLSVSIEGWNLSQIDTADEAKFRIDLTAAMEIPVALPDYAFERFYLVRARFEQGSIEYLFGLSRKTGDGRTITYGSDPIFIGFVMDYADDERVVFHGEGGLFVYDLVNETLLNYFDLGYYHGAATIQGGEGLTCVEVNAEGTKAMCYYNPRVETPGVTDPNRVLLVDIETGEAEVVRRFAFDEVYDGAVYVGDLNRHGETVFFPDGTGGYLTNVDSPQMGSLTSLRYVRGDRSWQLIPEGKIYEMQRPTGSNGVPLMTFYYGDTKCFPASRPEIWEGIAYDGLAPMQWAEMTSVPTLPWQGTTTVQYTIPEESPGALRLYIWQPDSLGSGDAAWQEVEITDLGWQGSFELRSDGSYYYLLTAEFGRGTAEYLFRVEITGQDQMEQAFFAWFDELDADSMRRYVEKYPAVLNNGWGGININAANGEYGSTGIYTRQGDEVLAIDAANGILLVRVGDEQYRGVLAIVKDTAQVSLRAADTLGESGGHCADIADEAGALLAINASGYYDYNGDGNGGTLIGYAMYSGEAVGTPMGEGYQRVELRSDDKLYIVDSTDPVDPATRDAMEWNQPLLINGVPQENGATEIHPRSAIGQTAEGEILLYIAEGRMPEEENHGATGEDVTADLQRYGCTQATLQDGGSSAIMVYRGEEITRCSNGEPQGRLLPNAWVVTARK